ncbi:hypothetical protein SOVF_065730 isoform B [Spinacia oleracea]|nr:hypothetical protein SOVF_065730 isoform B [Spinacia oleracea]
MEIKDVGSSSQGGHTAGDADDDPNAVLGVKMEPCITPYSGHDHKADEVNCLHGLLD